MKQNVKIIMSTLVLAGLLSACVEATTTSLSTSSELPSTTSTSSSVTTTSVSSESISTSVSSSVESSSVSSSSVSSSSSGLSYQEKAELDIASINLAEDMKLITRGTNGSTFKWVSSHPDVITTKGGIINPPMGGDPVEVTLTATVTNGTYKIVKDYPITVQPAGELTYTSMVSLPFYNTSEEYLVEDDPDVSVFYMNSGNVPYMDVRDFVELLDGAIDSEVIDITATGGMMTMTYGIDDEDFDGTPIHLDFTASLDFDLNTFTVNNFDFFSYYVMSTETDFGEGLTYTDATYIDGQSVTIPLGDYRFDMVVQNDYYLMPLHVLDLLFANSLYYDVYYNGDEIWGLDTYSRSDTEITDQLRSSTLNTAVMPKDVKQATYHYLALAFDYFYGLKDDKGIDSFYDELLPYANGILGGTDKELYSGLFDFIFDLDDLHSWHEATGYYEATTYGLQLTSLSQLGDKSSYYYTQLWAVEDQLVDAFDLDPNTMILPEYRLIDDSKIAIIYLDEFSVDTPVDVNAILSVLPESVKSVIIDLTYNGGGNVGAVFRLFGYMTEDPILYSSKNPADGSAATYYMESDYVAYDYNWFVETSSVTFSAANLMASMAQEMGVATIIGQNASGGASSIGMFVTPDGSILMRSSNSVSSRVEYDGDLNPTYISIENGVIVDVALNNLYSDTEIASVINGLID